MKQNWKLFMMSSGLWKLARSENSISGSYFIANRHQPENADVFIT